MMEIKSGFDLEKRIRSILGGGSVDSHRSDIL